MRSRQLVAFSLLALPALAQTYFPPPTVPAGNPLTVEKALLGMALFWEEQLSSSNTTACGTCHVFGHGGADPRGAAVHPGADGVFGTPDDVRASAGVRARDAAQRFQPVAGFGLEPQVTPRKAPSVINAAYSTALFYDGRVVSAEFRDPLTNQIVLGSDAALENLALQPPLNPVEMGHAGRTWQDVTTKLAAAQPLALAANLPSRLQGFVQGQSYPALFARAFGSAEITPARIAMALASYMRTLIADQSPFDRFVAGVGQLSGAETTGMAVFTRAANTTNAAAACSQCHGDVTAASHRAGPRFEGTTMYGGGPSGTHRNFHNIGVRPPFEDRGRAVVTNQAADEGRFKVPMLRNVALRAPFFHTGGMATLDDVVAFYDRGGDFHVNQAPEIRPRNLTAGERSGLVAFLRALTDPRVQNESAPFDRPTLGSERNQGTFEFGAGMQTTAGAAARSVVEGPPLVGAPRYSVGLGGVPPGAPVFLMWDVAAQPAGTSMFGLQLYLAMTPAFQLVSAGTSGNAAGAGYANVSFAVPNQASLRGFALFGQWLVADGQNSLGFVGSSGFGLVVQ